MAAPILILAGIAVAIASGVAALALLRPLGGKSILVLGGLYVGKSALIHFMRGKRRRYEQNTQDFPRKYDAFKLITPRGKLSVREGLDIAGDPDQYDVWKEQYPKADIVLYLVDVHRIQSDKQYADCVFIHAQHLKRWDQAAKHMRPEALLIVGTHCDLLSPARRLSRVLRATTWARKIRLIIDDKRLRFVFGSLEDHTAARELIHSIVEQILDR